MAILRFLGQWLVIGVLCLVILGIPLLRLAIHTYQAIVTKSWISLGFCVLLMLFFTWILVTSLQNVARTSFKTRLRLLSKRSDQCQ
ncbi:hypothetical protein [Symmachiella dynata]|uniref:hypothetical protein n=1 Tax=Symmachiella dynata TaxID=2527995 RepID=UPI001189A4F0|nr:hypothetical protein [Symmachiella dynata]QDT47846.1 hypothetical protein Pan258_18850 [Symmachiella dynata]|tara:strand:+ start:373 stop:630 length:258 start_codon:yes stop_codon:yes gene_type:complete